MGNIGAGEFFKAYLVKESVAQIVDSQIKTTSLESIGRLEGVRAFKFRYLTNNEMTTQPISGWLKGQFEKVLFTSETDIQFNERDVILFEDSTRLRIVRVLTQSQHGAFLINKHFPHILELS